MQVAVRWSAGHSRHRSTASCRGLLRDPLIHSHSGHRCCDCRSSKRGGRSGQVVDHRRPSCEGCERVSCGTEVGTYPVASLKIGRAYPWRQQPHLNGSRPSHCIQSFLGIGCLRGFHLDQLSSSDDDHLHCVRRGNHQRSFHHRKERHPQNPS